MAHNGGEIFNAETGFILAEGGTWGGPQSAVAIYLGRGNWQIEGFAISVVDVVNYGHIEALSTSSDHNSVGIYANNLESESMIIENHGLIRADIAIYVDQWSGTTSLLSSQQEVINSSTGSIEGGIELSLGSDFIMNLGTIDGYVDMGGGGDAILNGGSISGIVTLGSGLDRSCRPPPVRPGIAGAGRRDRRAPTGRPASALQP